MPWLSIKRTITVSEARANLYRLLDDVNANSEPVQITGRHANAVLLSEADWRVIEETIHLLSIPGMRESIRDGLAIPVEDCAEELDW
ncbi:MAG: type II toxin-antitoxin system Phd/YefM family antitoxin [Acidobacteria bacterium]|nr:MAG: type II toxin-antitoxin system Phd/YefM family antitoxin [Acidobacteriota bacterium]